MTSQIPLSPSIAYFSMEIGLEESMPTYAGGLGVLAGDSLRAAADLGLPLCAVTLLHRKGYFRQVLSKAGDQSEEASDWRPEERLQELPVRLTVEIEGREVTARIWRYGVTGISGLTLPVYLLDTSLDENCAEDRALTDSLYGGDSRYRFRQEVLLGIGGVAALRALGHRDIRTYHRNEAHSALLALALLEESTGRRDPTSASLSQVQAVRDRCVFTVHTPVAAGHDEFPAELAREVLGEERGEVAQMAPARNDGGLDMTALALLFSRSTNGVSMRHAQVSRSLYPGHQVEAITNGVQATTWACAQIAKLFDERLHGWRQDNSFLRQALGIPLEELQQAHAAAKQELLAEVDARTGLSFDRPALTIGFARRATGYKRAALIFSDVERLARISKRAGPVQLLFAGKAHARDESGKAAIKAVVQAAAALEGRVNVAYLDEYDMALARLLVSGVDLWLNNPEKPLEASGTSGMKAAINGVPSLSTLDGWWVEGHIEGLTGWSIGDGPLQQSDPVKEAASLYDKLEFTIMPLFYQRHRDYAEVMRGAMAYNGSYFNAQRMMSQYAALAYGETARRTVGEIAE